MTEGGLPIGRATLIVGGPGTGKTVFALETLVRGIHNAGEPGVFVSMEEPVAQIRANAAGFDWQMNEIGEDRLSFIEALPPVDMLASGEFDIGGLLAAVDARAQQIGARRVVIDGIDMMLNLLGDRALERRELLRLLDWVRRRDFTVVLTAKLDTHEEGGGRWYTFLEYVADLVVHLDSFVSDVSFVRVVRIPKYRGSNCVPGPFPLEITADGIRISLPAPPEPTKQTGRRLVSSGIERLDKLLGGGFLAGRTVLVSGHPGTAKSSLGAAFAEQGCRAGERAMIVGFDEPPEQLVANMRSIGIDLDRHIRSGKLKILGLRANSRNAARHYVQIEAACEQHAPQRLIIDPVSALLKLRGYPFADLVAESLLALTRSRGITLFCTSLDQPNGVTDETTASHISTIADTWINLSYANVGGERNRSLTVIKSRGMAHSSQVRELVLSKKGITLADVYAAEGTVLMGTARAEREMSDRRAEEVQELDFERQKLRLEREIAQERARSEELRRSAERNKKELELLKRREVSRRDYEYSAMDARLHLRRGD